MEPNQSPDIPAPSVPTPPAPPKLPADSNIENANIVEQPTTLVEIHEEIVSNSQEPENIVNQEVLSSSKIEDTANEENSEQIRKLKIASLIITIIAGLGSVVYYVYSMTVGDTMILKPADTVIIQNSDLQLDQAIAKDKATEQSVIDKVLELQKTKRDFIPLDYYVGKILEVNIPEIPKFNEYGTPNDPRTAGLTLKIQKTYDIANKKRLNDEVNCTIDSVNVRYFQKWKELGKDDLDMAGIKLKQDDLIGFRYTEKDDQSICELFQVNNVNLTDYISSSNSTFKGNSSNNTTTVITGRIEDFTPMSEVTLANYNNPQGIKEIAHIMRFNSGSIFGLPNIPGLNNTIVVFLTTYLDYNPDAPLGNISCPINNKQTQELAQFFLQSNLSPMKEKDRFILQLQGSGTTETIMIPGTDSGTFGSPLKMSSTFYQECVLEKIDLLDMGLRNIIDTYTFGK